MSWTEIVAATVKVDTNMTGIPRSSIDNGTVGLVLNAVFIVIGSLSVLFVIIGGLRYVIANGDSKQISQAKDTILYALVGVIVTILAFVIVQLVLGLF